MANTPDKKVLIVDDEAFIRLLIMQTLEELEELGVEIITSDNGVDALETIKKEMPNLVFLDVMIPRMSGFDVCRKVKRDLAMGEVYIVILTAKGQEYDRQVSQDAGADVYMTKPFDPDELLELARNVLAV